VRNWKLTFALFGTVSGDHFRAMGIPLLEGRYFARDDRVMNLVLSERSRDEDRLGKGTVGANLSCQFRRFRQFRTASYSCCSRETAIFGNFDANWDSGSEAKFTHSLSSVPLAPRSNLRGVKTVPKGTISVRIEQGKPRVFQSFFPAFSQS
jgi:hypothetical protein